MATLPMAAHDGAHHMGPRPPARLGLCLVIRASVGIGPRRGRPGIVGKAIAAAVPLLFLIASAAPVLADGIPSYTLGQVEPDRFYPSLFESRQLARVDAVNDTHERISLFLSVYSLDPGDDLTIMVPLRTLPVNVTGTPMRENEFRDTYRLDKAAAEVVRQDPDEAWARLREEATGALESCAGSLLMTAPGEYLRERLQLVTDSDGRKGESLGMDESVVLNPEPVSHYEFDGFSIDVYGVGAGPQLEQYLAQRNLAMPSTGDLQRYNTHYIALVQGRTEPPIQATDFAVLQENAPNTTARLGELLRDAPTRSLDDIEDLKYDLGHDAAQEYRYDHEDGQYSLSVSSSLRSYMGDLVDAVFGPSDFAGEVLSIVLPLDGGKAFFPLGTSAGWPNKVGAIDILFRVPEGKRLSLPSSRDAYFDGAHWHLFHMEHANPGFDLESQLLRDDDGRAGEARRAGFVYDHAGSLGGLLAALIVIVAWFGAAVAARTFLGSKGPTLRSPALWAMLALSVLLSLPGAVLAYLLARPAPEGGLRADVTATTHLLAYPIAIVLFAVGVSL